MASDYLEIPGIPRIELTRRKGQKSLRLRIREGNVVVSAPKSVPKYMIKEFVVSRKSWIQKKLNLQEQKEDQFANLAGQYRLRMLLRGDWKPIEEVEVKHQNGVYIEEQKDKIFVRKDPLVSQQFLNKAAVGFYKQLAKSELPKRIQELTGKMPIHVNRVTIRNQKTRWGSCSSKGSISLNWRLMKLPASICDYILIHELCHRIHMNHSKQFWDLVRSWYPDADKADAWIKKHESFLFADIGYGSLLLRE